MVLSGAHYTKSWGRDGGDVLGMILRPLAGYTSKKVTFICARTSIYKYMYELRLVLCEGKKKRVYLNPAVPTLYVQNANEDNMTYPPLLVQVINVSSSR